MNGVMSDTRAGVNAIAPSTDIPGGQDGPGQADRRCVFVVHRGQ